MTSQQERALEKAVAKALADVQELRRRLYAPEREEKMWEILARIDELKKQLDQTHPRYSKEYLEIERQWNALHNSPIWEQGRRLSEAYSSAMNKHKDLSNRLLELRKLRSSGEPATAPLPRLAPPLPPPTVGLPPCLPALQG